MEVLCRSVSKIASQTAFSRINNAARIDLLTSQQQRCAEGMLRMYARKHMQVALNLMRETNFTATNQALTSFENQTEKEMETQATFYKNTVHHNC